MTIGTPSEQASPANKKTGRGWGFLAAAGIGILLLVCGMTVFSRSAQAGLWNRVASFVTGRPLRFDVSSPSVVEMIRQLSRMETVEYSLDKIVEGGRQNAFLPDFLTGDKLLLVAHGEVIAGIDLYRHPLGRYPGGSDAFDGYNRVHDRDVEIDLIRQTLSAFAGEVEILSPILSAARYPCVVSRPTSPRAVT